MSSSIEIYVGDYNEGDWETARWLAEQEGKSLSEYVTEAIREKNEEESQ